MAEMNSQSQIKDKEMQNRRNQSRRPNTWIIGGLNREKRHFTRKFLRTQCHELIN